MTTPAASTSQEMQRRPELDGIRGLAILMVMAYHYVGQPLALHGEGVAALAGKSLRLFWSGVDLFFVLSGFLIGGILLQQRHAQNYFQVFFVRRGCRIWPLYLFVLMIFIILGAWGQGKPGYEALETGPVPLWSYFLFLQNIFMAAHHTFGADWLTVTWSLAVEEQFYLLLPFMVRFLPGRKLVYASMAGIVAVVLLRMIFSRDFLVFVSSPTRADAVLIGLLLAVAMRHDPTRALMTTHVALIGTLVLLGGIGMLILTFNQRLLGEALYLWTALFYAGLITLATLRQPSWLHHLLSARWLQFAGIISYGLYLLHTPAAWLIERSVPALAGHDTSSILAKAALSAALTLVASTATFYGFERACVNLGHRLKYRHV